jgi:hypothetical protein
MAGPIPLGYALAVVMLAMSVYCAGRLAAAGLAFGSVERDADLGHVAMGVAMAGMLVPRLNPLPRPAWEAIFAAVTVWFAWRATRGHRHVAGHYAQHGLHGAAMVYMLAAAGTVAGGGHGMSGAMTTVSVPELAVIFALLLLGCAIWEVDHLTAPPPDLLTIAPRLAGLCRAALSVTMGYMLIIMI